MKTTWKLMVLIVGLFAASLDARAANFDVGMMDGFELAGPPNDVCCTYYIRVSVTGDTTGVPGVLIQQRVFQGWTNYMWLSGMSSGDVATIYVPERDYYGSYYEYRAVGCANGTDCDYSSLNSAVGGPLPGECQLPGSGGGNY